MYVNNKDTIYICSINMKLITYKYIYQNNRKITLTN